ncbi:MAG: hypothetical protein ACETWK_01270 [Candidatus Aminicenantaceae bacterium]
MFTFVTVIVWDRLSFLMGTGYRRMWDTGEAVTGKDLALIFAGVEIF